MANEFDDGIASGLEYERTGLDASAAPAAPVARGGIAIRTPVPSAPPAGRTEEPADAEAPARRDDERQATVDDGSTVPAEPPPLPVRRDWPIDPPPEPADDPGTPEAVADAPQDDDADDAPRDEPAWAGWDDLDRLLGTRQGDRLWGGDGDDVIVGDHGNDVLGGNAGHDALIAGGGEDTVWGGTGASFLHGGQGNDLLVGTDEADGGDMLAALIAGTLGGAAPPDWAHADGDAIVGGYGNDLIGGDAGDDLVYGGEGGDELWGGDGADRLAGGAGNDRIGGDDGDDWLHGGAGDDTLWGGAGDDTYVFGRTDGRDHVYDDAGENRLVVVGRADELGFREHDGWVTLTFRDGGANITFSRVEIGAIEYVEAVPDWIAKPPGEDPFGEMA